MRLFVLFSISFIAGNYALSLPLADIGMIPDYALENDQVEPVELEMGGDYVNMDYIGSNQHEKGTWIYSSPCFHLLNKYINTQNVGLDENEFDHPIMQDRNEHESQENEESSIDESNVSEELYQLDIDHYHDKFRHPHNGGHYTLPVESNPTI
jgi:hypothetical protein